MTPVSLIKKDKQTLGWIILKSNLSIIVINITTALTHKYRAKAL